MPKAKKRPTPKVGSEFKKPFKGKLYKLVVVKVDGGIGFQVEGKIFSSPSTAGVYVMKSKSCNGWVFWGMD